MAEPPYEVGFLGAGNMAYAIVKGILAAGIVKPNKIILSSPTGKNFHKFEALGTMTTKSNDSVLASSKIVFFAAKPYHVEEVLDFTGREAGLYTCETVISMAAGVNIKTIRELINRNRSSIKNIIRIMPNTPCQLQKGAISVTSEYLSDPNLDRVIELLSSCGIVEQMEEKTINAFMGISGCGVAFCYSMMEAMSDAGVEHGMNRASATRFAAQTFLGAAAMVLESGKHTGELKDQVTSPGGTTIAGIHALEKGGVRAGIMDAVSATITRSKQIENE